MSAEPGGTTDEDFARLFRSLPREFLADFALICSTVPREFLAEWGRLFAMTLRHGRGHFESRVEISDVCVVADWKNSPSLARRPKAKKIA